MTTKIKSTQKEDLVAVSGRDLFQTPNYATDLLVPFLRDVELSYDEPSEFTIWECASGNGRMENRLREHGFEVFGTDLSTGCNFLTDKMADCFDCIVTNPPYSLKKKFYDKCLSYEVPFALLIPFDMAGWMWNAYENDGCQGIIPSRRINFITPSGKSEATGHTANFHSFWLTYGFCLENQFNFVELTAEDKQNI